MRPLLIPKYIKSITDAHYNEKKLISDIQYAYKQLQKDKPLVSIVIPVYNEEENILTTLFSLCNNITQWPIEIIVVNNNSNDRTEEIVKAAGINCINEINQGIKFARNAGLAVAKGKYILNADADTVYPKQWIELMVNPLIQKNSISVVYGRFSFIPSAKTSRFVYFFYEYLADLTRWSNKTFRDGSSNVYGFNSGFRKEQGLSVDGFNHPVGTNEDGHLALKLREKGYGKLYYVTDFKALVWTSDRRIQLDGGLIRGIIKRLKRFLDFS